MKPVILILALNDLKEIHGMLSDYGNTPPQKFRESIERFCINVSTMPYMYAQYDLNQSYRRAVIAYDYLVFYQVESIRDKTRVRIYRVLYGKRNILPLLDSAVE